MAKTRDDKFRLAFDSFVKNTIGIEEYSLENLTKNKIENTHIYSFTIPSQVKIIGYIDRNGLNENNEENVKPIEYQYMPIEENLRDQVMDAFGPHELTKTYMSYGISRPYVTRLSYVDIDRCHLNEDNGITGKLIVIYYKSHIPYELQEDPKEFEKKYLNLLNRFNKLDGQNTELLDNIDELNDELCISKRQTRNFKKRLFKEENLHIKYEKSLKNKLRDTYATLKDTEDCPVCYDPLDGDTLIIPSCAHYICKSCYERCNMCPICRDEYLENEYLENET